MSQNTAPVKSQPLPPLIPAGGCKPRSMKFHPSVPNRAARRPNGCQEEADQAACGQLIFVRSSQTADGLASTMSFMSFIRFSIPTVCAPRGRRPWLDGVWTYPAQQCRMRAHRAISVESQIGALGHGGCMAGKA